MNGATTTVDQHHGNKDGLLTQWRESKQEGQPGQTTATSSASLFHPQQRAEEEVNATEIQPDTTKYHSLLSDYLRKNPDSVIRGTGKQTQLCAAGLAQCALHPETNRRSH